MTRTATWITLALAGIAPSFAQAQSVILKDADGVDAYEATFQGVTYNDDGTSTWIYDFRELGTGKDLSHWAVGLEPCHRLAEGTTEGYDFGPDGSTGFWGLKWDVEEEFEEGTFFIVLDRQHQLGDVDVIAKGGSGFDTGTLPGPICDEVVDEPDDPGQDPPADGLHLDAVVRDFLGTHESPHDGVVPHADFGRAPDAGFGHYMGNLSRQMDFFLKPKFNGGGAKVTYQWRDADGRPIHPCVFDPDLGDIPGVLGELDNGGIGSAESFQQWFRDVPGVNLSGSTELFFERQDDGSYLFSSTDFFPIDGQLLGNTEGHEHNHHFTLELQMQFVYEEVAGQYFRFTGDDDVWVFLNGWLVIDLGGVHSPIEQVIELDRLNLVDGNRYPLSLFFAERFAPGSQFEVETTIDLWTPLDQSISPQYD